MTKETYRDIVESSIAGIPCLIGIKSYFSKKPDFFSKDSDVDYYGYTDMDYDILDRKGYRAAWLEKKATEKDIDKIEQDVIDYFED